MVFASLLITSGALADRFGRKRVFLIGLVVFGTASIACAFAPSPATLIAARAAQGVGASMLTPVALAIVVNVMRDPRERAQALGVWSAMFGVSMAAGPVVGGALISAFDWRAVFWINAPIVAVALLLVSWLVPESRGERPRRLDLPGQLLLFLLLATGVALLIEGPRIGWNSLSTLPAYALIVATALAFVRVESKHPHPLIEPSLFRVPSLVGAVVGAVVVFIAFSMTLLMTTALLQNVRGWTPLAAGAATLPMALGAIVCAPLSGYLLGRFGARLPLLLAGAFITLGGGLLTAISVMNTANLAWLLTAYLVMGTGVGFANAPLTNTAVSGLPRERAGVAGGITSTSRQFGTAIGIALAGSLITDTSPEGFAARTLPGWIIVTVCGAVLLAVTATARPGRRE